MNDYSQRIKRLEDAVKHQLKPLETWDVMGQPEKGYFIDYHGVLTGIALAGLQLETVPAPLLEFNELCELNLEENRLTDLSPLIALPQLANLNVAVNRLTDVSPLRSLTRLEFLYLNHNQLTDVSVLQTLPELKTIYLGHNQLTDCSCFEFFERLQYLDLRNNRITHMSAGIKETWMEIRWEKEWYYMGVNFYGNPMEKPAEEDAGLPLYAERLELHQLYQKYLKSQKEK